MTPTMSSFISIGIPTTSLTYVPGNSRGAPADHVKSTYFYFKGGVTPSNIDTTVFTHLYSTFASMDSVLYQVDTQNHLNLLDYQSDPQNPPIHR